MKNSLLSANYNKKVKITEKLHRRWMKYFKIYCERIEAVDFP